MLCAGLSHSLLTFVFCCLPLQREQRMEQLQQIEDEGVSYDDVHPPGKETFGFSPIMANPLRKLDRKLQ